MATSIGKSAFDNKIGVSTDGEGTSLVYPSDYDPKFFPECIKFGIYEREGISLKDAGGIITTAAGSATAALQEAKEKGAGVSTSDERTKTADGAIAVGKVGKKLASDVYTHIKDGMEARKNLATKLKRNIYLNMPDTVAFNETASWEGSNLGMVGAVLNSDASSLVPGAAGQAATAAGGVSGAILGMTLGSAAVGGVAGLMAGSLMGGTAIGDAFSAVTNVTANPYKEQTFQGIDFRAFTFSFKFRARNQSEIMVIKSIIESFRAFSKPSFKEGTGLFSYPHEFQIEFLTHIGGSLETNEYLPSLKYCICDNVTTNYGEGTWKSFKDGAPTEISLSLGFKETELITHEDVIGKTGHGRFKVDSGTTGRKF